MEHRSKTSPDLFDNRLLENTGKKKKFQTDFSLLGTEFDACPIEVKSDTFAMTCPQME